MQRSSTIGIIVARTKQEAKAELVTKIAPADAIKLVLTGPKKTPLSGDTGDNMIYL